MYLNTNSWDSWICIHMMSKVFIKVAKSQFPSHRTVSLYRLGFWAHVCSCHCRPLRPWTLASNRAAPASCCWCPGLWEPLWELCLLTVANHGFCLGAGVCPFPEGNWEDSQSHPGHVPREGHSGSVSERGLSLHRSPSDWSWAVQGEERQAPLSFLPGNWLILRLSRQSSRTASCC